MFQRAQDPRLVPVDWAFRCFSHGKSAPDGLWLVCNADWLENTPGFCCLSCLCRSCEMARVQINTSGADITDAQLAEIPEVD